MFTVQIKANDFKDPAKWAEISKALELPAGRTEAIVTRIPGLLPVIPGMKVESHGKPPDEWMIEEYRHLLLRRVLLFGTPARRPTTR